MSKTHFKFGLTAIVEQYICVWCEGAGYTLSLLYHTMKRYSYLPKRAKDIFEQVYLQVLSGLPVVMIVSLFTGMVLALQSGLVLKIYGQEANVGYIVSVTLCRELGPVMAAFVLAGLIGSTMAAELGTMKVSEEIDALESMSIDPIQFLVLPRVVALSVVAPLLTIYADFIGTIGGAVVSSTVLNIDYTLYFDKSFEILSLKDVYSGLFKAYIFGVTISVVGCSEGLRAQNGASGVGKATMKAVVISFIFILIFDYLLTWFLYQIY